MFAKLASEFIGTFFLVLFGCTVAAQYAGKENPGLATALAFGIALIVIIYAWSSISGANVNPAVSLGLAVNGQLSYGTMFLYWIAQVLGAIAAAALMVYIIGKESGLGASIGSLTNTDPWKAVLVEGLLTFVLVYAVLVMTNNPQYANFAAIGIGLALLVGVLVGYYLTGGSLNPARSIGPALFTNNMGTIWIYIVGPLLGGLLAALVYRGFNRRLRN